MLLYSHLPFLREKINDLKSALFICQHNAILKMATTIVSVCKVDDFGQMWFFVSRPRQALYEFDREFPVRLEFFKKGKKFYLHVSGKAYIVTDPEEIIQLEQDIPGAREEHSVLIRVKMLKADYFENTGPTGGIGWSPIGWWRERFTPAVRSMSCSLAIASLALVCFSCNNGGSSDSTTAAKDSNAAKMDTAVSGDSTSGRAIPTSVSASDADFVVGTAVAGMTEIQAGQIAESAGSDKDVKEYGAMMVKDHTAAANTLKNIADSKHITLPAALPASVQQSLNNLQKKSGTDFDKAFLSMMVSDHKKAISAFQKESKNGSDADIRAFADNTLGTLQKHLADAQKCEKMMKKM
jgi:putative membrane protein